MNSPLATQSMLQTLPFTNTLDKVFSEKAFLETTDGAAKFERYNKAYNIFSRLKKWMPYAFAAFVLISFFTHFLASSFGAFLLCCIVIYAVYSYFKFDYKRKAKRYGKDSLAFAVNLAKTIIKIIGGYYYIFPDTQILFYNNEICIYADSAYGGLIAYNKASIKKVNLEHVHLGSTTVSTSKTSGFGYNSGRINQNTLDYRGRSSNYSTTQTTENTQIHYEWKLDILTSFIKEPHITLVFPDDKDGEESAKRACAVLS